jgi:cytochrome P450
MRSPYPIFAQLRKQGAMVTVNPVALMGGDPDAAPPAGVPEIYSAVGYDAVSEVLRDGARFSSRGYAMMMGPVMGHSILEMDEPEHGRVRGMPKDRACRAWTYPFDIKSRLGGQKRQDPGRMENPRQRGT